MASIYKRGNVWWIHYYVGGQPVSRSLKTGDGRIAEDKRRKLEALEATDQLVLPSRTPLSTVLQSFCEYLQRTQSHKSYRNDLSYLRGFFGCCCPALQLGSHVPHKFRHAQRPLPTIPDAQRHRHVPVSCLEQVSGELIAGYIRERLVQDRIAPKTANRIREVLHRLFNFAAEHHGYVCPDRRCRNPADCGQAALQALAHEPVEVALLDMMLPDMDGREILKAIGRSRPPSLRVVLAVTGDATEARRAEVEGVGADGLVTKPIDIAVLVGQLQSALAGASGP